MKTIARLLTTVAFFGFSSLAFATAPKKAESTKMFHATGTIISENTTKNEMLVAVKRQGKLEELSFTVQPDAKLALAGKPVALSDLQKGENVQLSYLKEGGGRNVAELNAMAMPAKKAATKVAPHKTSAKK